MRSWYVVLASLLSVLILRTSALASTAFDIPASAREADCKSTGAWVSRNFALTPTARRECVLADPGSTQQLRVSHLRRGGSTGADFLANPLALTPTPVTYRAPLDETRSRLDLAGSWNRWSYETKFALGRTTRLATGRLQPEARSELRFTSSFDLGYVRPGIEVREAIAEKEPEIDRTFEVPGDSRALAGGRAFVDVTLPNAPVLMLAVGREQLESFREHMPEQLDLFREHTSVRSQMNSDFATGALWYQRERWQAYGSSSVYQFRDATQPGSPESKLYFHNLSGSYWPIPTLTINPSVQYSDASYDGGGSWTRTLSANLGVYTTALEENGLSGLLTLWSGYTRSYDTSKSFDYEQLDLAVGAERAITTLPRLGGYGLSVGGSVGYSHYFDRLDSGNSAPGYRVLLMLRISEAPECATPGSAATRACAKRREP
jgi:hypothetical protein